MLVLGVFIVLFGILSGGTTGDPVVYSIFNMYQGVFLETLLKTVSTHTAGSIYWDFTEITQDNFVIKQRARSYHLCIDSVNKRLKLCADGTAFDQAPKWVRDKPAMHFYTVESEKKYYLSINKTNASVSTSANSNQQRIMVSAVKTWDKKPVWEELEGVRDNLTKTLSEADMRLGEVTNMVAGVKKRDIGLRVKMREESEKFDSLTREVISTLHSFVEKFHETEEWASSSINTINSSISGIDKIFIPEIWESITEIREQPSAFKQKLNQKDVEEGLDTKLDKISSGISKCISKHRVIPESPYDYLVIFTTAIFVVYFADLVRRVAGWKSGGGARRMGTPLGLDMGLRTGTVSNIEHDYFLEAEVNDQSTFEISRDNIKGKLQLKPLD